MSTYIRQFKPFAFWLVEQFLPAEENQTEETQQISDREFYSIMGMLFFSVCVLSLVFHVVAS